MKKRLHKKAGLCLIWLISCGILLTLGYLICGITHTPLPTAEIEAASAPAKVQPVSVQTASKASASSLSAKWSCANSWNDGQHTFTQLNGKLTNSGTAAISNWKLTCTVPKGTVISQSWNGSYSINGTTLTVTPVDYNKEIPAGGSIDIGCIVSASKKVDPQSTSCTGTSSTASTAYSQNNAASASSNPSSQPSAATSGSSSSSALLPKVTLTPEEKAAIAKNGDWLYAKGNKIYDKNGQEVWITGINWFGYNTGTNTFDGLWQVNLDASIAAIADHGFNLLRVPISAELINNWSKGFYPTANFNQAANSQLVGKNSQQIFDYALALCKKNGLKVMLDIHSAETNASGHTVNVWYTNKVSEADYLSALTYMANRYAADDTILAFDLKNEPHGKPNESPRAIWNNSKDPNNWKYIAEKAAGCILKENPNVLIMVEGIEIYPKNIKTNSSYASTSSADYYFNWWGGNLRGVKDYPINLGSHQNKLVYSPHDYGPTVYQQPWFKQGYTYDSLYRDCWKDNWFYIYEDQTAPLLIGEWGGFMREPNLAWMTDLKKLISKFKLHHTFWCFNANSGDTGGLVLDDFSTWDQEKYLFVKDVLWQKNGKFVGLDQEIPLGKNGISLKNYSSASKK